METLRHLSPRARAACLTVADRIAAAGGRAHLVGGCVRDALLGEPCTDVDIEVYGLPAGAVEAALKKDFRVDTVGRAFGVFLLKGENIDIALPRRESRTGPKHTDFAVEGDPDMSPEEAASRRDFTINAIACDLATGELVDPCDGRADLEARRLRHVSPAFSEDPLRVLRGMQFTARFGLRADPATVELCRGLSPEHLPVERLWEEWKKLVLRGKAISAGLEFLRACGWTRFFPELHALIGCEQDPKWHPEGDVWTHTGHCMDSYASARRGDEWEDLVVGFAVLCHDMGKPATTYTDVDGRIRSPRHDVEGVPLARAFLGRITRHKRLIEAVLPLVAHHMRPLEFFQSRAGDAAIRRLALKVERIDRLTRVAHADKSGRPPAGIGEFNEGLWLLERAEALAVKDRAPEPIVRGRHLVEAGLQPGRQFGPLLDRCYDAQLEGRFDDLEGGKAFLKSCLEEVKD
jgi:tRNA nucleotidyltransferase (CCA-adding enzyme)